IARVGDDNDMAIRFCNRSKHVRRFVGAAVVDKDDLIVDADPAKRFPEALIHFGNRRCVAVAGDNHADLRATAHRLNGTGSSLLWCTARRTAAAIDEASGPCLAFRYFALPELPDGVSRIPHRTSRHLNPSSAIASATSDPS